MTITGPPQSPAVVLLPDAFPQICPQYKTSCQWHSEGWHHHLACSGCWKKRGVMRSKWPRQQSVCVNESVKWSDRSNMNERLGFMCKRAHRSPTSKIRDLFVFLFIFKYSCRINRELDHGILYHQRVEETCNSVKWKYMHTTYMCTHMKIFVKDIWYYLNHSKPWK